MPGTLRWGILGPGGIARQQTSDLIESGFSVVAVGSRSLESARSFADEFGIERAHEGYDALVADPDIDVIYVATPHSHHYEHAKLALEAGKHVLVEKAFTVTGDQAQILADLAEKSGLVVLEAMWARFLPHMARIREIIAAGTLGDVRTLLADHNQKLPSDPEHRLNNPALAGGALLDLGIYPVAFAWDIFGAPTTTLAHAALSETGVDRQTAIIYGYEGGRQAVLHTALDTRGPNRATILGTEGRIELDATWYNATSFTVYDKTDTVIETYESSISGRGMQFQAAELERLVEGGLLAGELLPPSESVAIMRSLDEIRRQISLDYPADIMAV